LTRNEIVAQVARLGLTRYDAADFVCGCDWEKSGMVEEEISGIEKELTKLEGHERYDQFKADAEQIIARFREVGGSCATQLDVVGVK
jgi:hypothetical protein